MDAGSGGGVGGGAVVGEEGELDGGVLRPLVVVLKGRVKLRVGRGAGSRVVGEGGFGPTLVLDEIASALVLGRDGFMDVWELEDWPNCDMQSRARDLAGIGGTEVRSSGVWKPEALVGLAGSGHCGSSSLGGGIKTFGVIDSLIFWTNGGLGLEEP